MAVGVIALAWLRHFAFIRPDDCLVVWKLDRLGRSLPHLLATVNDLKTQWAGIAFRSLTERMDTTTYRRASSCFMSSARWRNLNWSSTQERV